MHPTKLSTMIILSFARLFSATESYSLSGQSSSLVQTTSGEVLPSDSQPSPSSEDRRTASSAFGTKSLGTYATDQAASSAAPADRNSLTWREDGECRGRSRTIGCIIAHRRTNRRRSVNIGDATYYGTGLGACGKTSTDSSFIAAASHKLFDNYPGATPDPNSNPICGRKVKATYKGSSVIVEIVDRCTGCDEYDLDFSPAAFEKMGALNVGRLHGMKWEWV